MDSIQKCRSEWPANLCYFQIRRWLAARYLIPSSPWF